MGLGLGLGFDQPPRAVLSVLLQRGAHLLRVRDRDRVRDRVRVRVRVRDRVKVRVRVRQVDTVRREGE